MAYYPHLNIVYYISNLSRLRVSRRRTVINVRTAERRYVTWGVLSSWTFVFMRYCHSVSWTLSSSIFVVNFSVTSPLKCIIYRISRWCLNTCWTDMNDVHRLISCVMLYVSLDLISRGKRILYLHGTSSWSVSGS